MRESRSHAAARSSGSQCQTAHQAAGIAPVRWRRLTGMSQHGGVGPWRLHPVLVAAHCPAGRRARQVPRRTASRKQVVAARLAQVGLPPYGTLPRVVLLAVTAAMPFKHCVDLSSRTECARLEPVVQAMNRTASYWLCRECGCSSYDTHC